MPLSNWLERLKRRSKQSDKYGDFAEYKKRFNQIYGEILPKLEPIGEPGLISAVLPVYNGAEYLSEAVYSVLNQTYRKFELIIVNDGSEDESGRIAKGFSENFQKVKYIDLKENKRLPTALNKGFDEAGGEFFTWVSHDNIMSPRFFEIMAAELEARPAAAMVYGNMKIIDEKGEVRRGHGWYEIPPMSGNVVLPENTENLNVIPNNTVGAAFLYRAKAARFLGNYDENEFGIEDYDYWMRMNEVFDIEHISYNKPLCSYRFHKKSLTARDRELGITANRPQLMERDFRRRESILAHSRNGSTDELKALLGQ